MAKFSLEGMVAYLQGKGWKVKLNEDAEAEGETFEIDEPEVDDLETEASSSDDSILSAEEIMALKGFAQVLAKNGKLTTALSDGSFDTALSTVPAAAALVANAQAREKAEKDQVIAVIKADPSNTLSDEELVAMPTSALIKLNARMNVSFAGMGGSMIQNASEPLAIRPILLAPAKED